MTTLADGLIHLLKAEPSLLPTAPSVQVALAIERRGTAEEHACLRCGARAGCAFVADTDIGARWLDPLPRLRVLAAIDGDSRTVLSGRPVLDTGGPMSTEIDREELLAVTRAIHDVDCDGGPDCGDVLTTYGRYGRYASAALAVVARREPAAQRRERSEPPK